jgi:hypothetical protein
MKKITIQFVLLAGIILGFTSRSLAQLSYYYENGKSATSTMLSKEKGSAQFTQMTFYGFDFVVERVHNCLTEELPFTPFEQGSFSKKGEFEYYSRKYKNQYNDELAPQRRYIETIYKTIVVEGERVIVSFEMRGLEDYIGQFYGGFWMPKIDAKVVQSGEIMFHNALQDHVSVQTKFDKSSSHQTVWIEVTNREIKDIAKFKSALAKKIIKDKQAKAAFDKRRNETTFALKEVNSETYTKLEEKVANAVKRNLLNYKGDFSGDLDIYMVVDTLGKLTVKMGNSTELNAGIIEDLQNSYFDKYTENGLYMKTYDAFKFQVSKKTEEGKVYLKNEVVEFQTSNSQTFETAINENKQKLSQGRGIYDVKVSSVTFNGNSTAEVETLSYKEKKSPKYYIVGGLLVLGVAGYYGYNLLKK